MRDRYGPRLSSFRTVRAQAAAAYFGGGLLYNVKRLGMPLEKESLPHYMFWTQLLPELVKEVLAPSPCATARACSADCIAGHDIHHSDGEGVSCCAVAWRLRAAVARAAVGCERRSIVGRHEPCISSHRRCCSLHVPSSLARALT